MEASGALSGVFGLRGPNGPKTMRFHTFFVILVHFVRFLALENHAFYRVFVCLSVSINFEWFLDRLFKNVAKPVRFIVFFGPRGYGSVPVFLSLLHVRFSKMC